MADSVKKCHRTATHNVMCNIVDLVWDKTPVGGSEIFCSDGDIKLGKQCVNSDSLDFESATYSVAVTKCAEKLAHVQQPMDVYQSVVTGIYAESFEFDTIWVGIQKIAGNWVKPDGRILEVVEQFWGPEEPKDGDCVVADAKIDYQHRTVNCGEKHQVSH